ncbi:MAG: transcription-repair coupling factor [Solobacterium sp.]|nr:transcription-repair coupling factor [Solobacterium sp.]
MLEDNAAVRKLNSGKSPLPMASLIAEAIVLAESYRQMPRPILVVKNSLYSAQRLYERLSSLLDVTECALFGADESLRVEAIAASPEMTAAKVETLSSLLENPCQIVVTCPSGFLRQLPSPEQFRSACITIRPGDVLEIDDLKRSLRAGGYTETSHIDQPLSFAARGGIVDVYSINYEHPVRIEFFDNEVDNIRFFDESTQKTLLPLNEVKIVPASDILFSDSEKKEIRKKAEAILADSGDVMLESAVNSALDLIDQSISEPGLYPYYALLDHTAGIADYMNRPLIVIGDEDLVRDSVKHLNEEALTYMQEMVQEKKFLPRYVMYHDYERSWESCRRIAEDPMYDNISGITEVHLPNETLSVRLRILSQEPCVLCVLRSGQMQKVINTCVAEDMPYHLITGEEPLNSGFNIMLGDLSEGFELNGVMVVTDRELFEIHHPAGRYEKKFRSAEVIHGYDELEPGDYIVHASHGVGQYIGIETREVQGTMRDFLRIVYKGNAELLVPLEQFRLVRKFVSREGVVPRLNKLGTNEWEKTKRKIEENVSDLAERLVSLYSSREDNIGYAFQKDSPLQKQFESEFAYELTPDQASAVEDVKRDMESEKPMDRLICGDVGFGKTEIAVRAAFKAAAENKQVAVLCPTTILAEQHFHTFQSRFENHPFTIRVLDRFVTPANVKETLKGLREGSVDIVIGTHRLLSRDVKFKDLGLLVVDEEQRFGVEHKEKIKELKQNIDVLTLSATPIPRTLQMSLVGIRSLSQLETPPANRYNVQIYVAEMNRGLITGAIEKELARDGQVFYLCNSIDRIYNTARQLNSYIPDAKVGIVHGQMDRESIEDVMYRFNQKELNVLVCTTIIENGIDIPNANTILIEDAQNFGLSQIYQIKGRVGRSDRVAYAYLLIPPRKQLSETASKRLQAVKEFARLGSGYRIAMRDLTIRGAGDMLGPEQSGFIDTVGIDMYIEMLEQAIEKKKGHVVEAEPERRHAVVSGSGYIPEQFAPDDFDKISMYQKIDKLNDFAALEEYRAEVVDQYGRLPKEVESLFQKRRLDIVINEPHVESYRELKGIHTITFTKEFSQSVDGIRLFRIFSDISKDIELRYTGQRIIASVPGIANVLEIVIQAITKAKEAVRNEN